MDTNIWTLVLIVAVAAILFFLLRWLTTRRAIKLAEQRRRDQGRREQGRREQGRGDQGRREQGRG